MLQWSNEDKHLLKKQNQNKQKTTDFAWGKLQQYPYITLAQVLAKCNIIAQQHIWSTLKSWFQDRQHSFKCRSGGMITA